MPGRPWNGEERTLRRLWAEKKSPAYIGVMVGRPASAVRCKARRLKLPTWPAPSKWDARSDELERRVAQGWSAGRIAAEWGLTRNAVIGRCHRVGLILAGSKAGRVILTDEQRQARQEARRARKANGGYRRPWTMQNAPKRPPTPANAPPSRNLPLVQLGPMDCRYPTNDAEQRDGHLFCGAIKDYTGPYCLYHAALVHNS